MVWDKNGRRITPGDVLKVFHFKRGRRHHYMYQQALRYERERLIIAYLNRLDDEPWEVGKNYYTIGADEGVMRDYEIVQSIDARLDERPRE